MDKLGYGSNVSLRIIDNLELNCDLCQKLFRTQSRWIKITDKLPEEGIPVLIYFKGEVQVAILGFAYNPKDNIKLPIWLRCGSYARSGKGDDWGWLSKEVTHWQSIILPNNN